VFGGSWKVTVRHRSDVGREKLGTLEEALREARQRVDEVLREGGLGAVTMLREFAPDQLVHARIEITGPGLLRRREGGIDVMGDGAVIAYSGAIRKEPLEAESLDDALDRLREALG
jgi:hypothetical protein